VVVKKKLINWLIFLLFFLFLRLLSQDWVTFFRVGSGFLPGLLFVVYIVVCQVLVFPSGTPGLIYSLYLVGVEKTYGYLYLAGLISALINYWLGRQYGEPFLRHFLDEKAIDKVKHISKKLTGTKFLALARVFAFPFFKYISYAAGVLRMDFKAYFLTTVVFSAVPIIFMAVLLRWFF
jgi:uncharacterized membrane protein YdjX (TVP38/TMEM64 family)